MRWRQGVTVSGAIANCRAGADHIRGIATSYAFRRGLPRPLALRLWGCGFFILFGERIQTHPQRTGNPFDDTEARVNLIEFNLTQILLTETCRLLQVLLLPAFINA